MWSQPNTTGKSPSGRYYHTATIIGNQMCVIGGKSSNLSRSSTFLTHEIFLLQLGWFSFSTFFFYFLPFPLLYPFSSPFFHLFLSFPTASSTLFPPFIPLSPSLSSPSSCSPCLFLLPLPPSLPLSFIPFFPHP